MAWITTNSKTFELLPGETLLEGLERTGHDVEYQCRSGYCGSCRLKKISGEVDYAEYPLAFLHQDEVLPCCCRVKSDLHIECAARVEEPDLFDRGLFDEQEH